MAEAIQNRRASAETIQQLQKDKAEKKRALGEQARQEMKDLKETFNQMSKEIDQETEAAISHIKTEAEENQKEYVALREERRNNSVYNRKGLKENGSEVKQSAKTSELSKPEQVQLSKKPETKSSEPEKRDALIQNYVTKETDSFYRVQDRGSRITEEADGYVIEAYAPAHEKDNLRMTIANNKAILSGKRKFQDSKEQEDKKISTNNFQTFHEEFKLGRAISTEGMTRERQGDYIKFFIPKLEAMNFDEES